MTNLLSSPPVWPVGIAIAILHPTRETKQIHFFPKFLCRCRCTCHFFLLLILSESVGTFHLMSSQTKIVSFFGFILNFIITLINFQWLVDFFYQQQTQYSFLKICKAPRFCQSPFETFIVAIFDIAANQQPRNFGRFFCSPFLCTCSFFKKFSSFNMYHSRNWQDICFSSNPERVNR